MKNILLLLIIFLVSNCSKTKTVFLCGDHVCVNKAEAEQYFEDNLSLEVQVIDNSKSNKIDLIELNLRSNEKGDKQVLVLDKIKPQSKIRTLSSKEIKKKKNQVKEKKKLLNKRIKVKKRTIKEKKVVQKINKNVIKPASSSLIQAVDICTILEKCSIDEISNYLINQGKNKKFPDITSKQ